MQVGQTNPMSLVYVASKVGTPGRQKLAGATSMSCTENMVKETELTKEQPVSWSSGMNAHDPVLSDMQ